MKIFTYGTLCTNGGNNHIILNAGGELVEEVHTELQFTFKYRMYPELYDTAGIGEIIYGELYEVPEESIHLLDKYEGHPDLYKRGAIVVVTSLGMVECDTYFYQEVNDSPRP